MNNNLISRNIEYFKNKKTIVQFVLALFVFFIHFRVFSTFKDASGFIKIILDAIMQFTFVAVPLFFAISGALFYRNYTLQSTKKKWKSRFFSLCVPYLLWNTIWLALAIIGYYTPLGNFMGGVKTPLTIEAVLSGIFLHRFFEPFWFMLQLIILTALCPAIYYLLRNKTVGTIIIFSLLLLYPLFVSEKAEVIFTRSMNMTIFYLIGAWIGLHHFEWVTKRRSKGQALFSCMIYFACCLFKGSCIFSFQFPFYRQVSLIVTLISCIAFYFSFDVFSFKSCPVFMKESFLVYAMHSLVGATLSKMLYVLFPDGELFIILNAIFTYIATIVFICIFGKFVGQYAPKIKRILVGR